MAAASVGIAFGTLPAGVAATIGAAVAVLIVVAASLHDSRPEVVTLLLAGVAVAAFAGALLAVIVSLSPSAAVRSITFWSSGSLALSTWSGVLSVAPFVVAGAALAASVARPLDVLSLGDRGAAAAGVDVRTVRYRALAAVVLLVGAGVGAVGVIAFVGLMIPHAVRAVIGPRHATRAAPERAGGLPARPRRGHARAPGRQPGGDPDRGHHGRHRRTGVLRPAPSHARTPGRMGMTSPPAAELRDASVRAGDRFRLHPTDLQIRGGAVTAVVGRNGSGKSTMLGRAVRRAGPAQPARALIGGARRARRSAPSSSRDAAPC